MAEDEPIFHIEKPPFSRSQLAKSPRSSYGGMESGDNGIQEKSRFLEKNVADEKADESALLVIPKDRFHQCYIIMYLLGFGSLMPSNFFFTANDYFRAKLESRPDLQITFQNYFSVAVMVPNIFMMLVNIFVLYRYNRILRLNLSIATTLLLFVFTAAFVLVDTKHWTGKFFAITLTTVVVLSIFCGILQGSVFGFAGMLPPAYTRAVMGGQGLCGLFAAVASIVSKLGHRDVYKSAFAYFIIASFVLLICFIAVIILFRLEFVKYYTREKIYKCTSKGDESKHEHSPDFVNEDASGKMMQDVKIEKCSGINSFRIVMKKIFPMAFSAVMMFLVTLACYPAITSRIVSVNEKKTRWTAEFFVPVTCFLFFNIGDYFGRSLPGFFQFPKKHWPKWILPLISVLRLLFIPIFIFCNAQPRTLFVVFNHDAFPSIFILLFSVTNGYFVSLAMMYGSSAVEAEHAELAGTIMGCSLSIGLGLGALSSFLVTSFI